MKNPLHKRYKRELRQDLGKYIAIFLFMVLSIGFISGFLVAGTSMKTAYDQSFKKYNIEDGHFILKEKADKDLIKTLQDDEHVKLYSQPYIEEKATLIGSTQTAARSIRSACCREEWPRQTTRSPSTGSLQKTTI